MYEGEGERIWGVRMESLDFLTIRLNCVPFFFFFKEWLYYVMYIAPNWLVLSLQLNDFLVNYGAVQHHSPILEHFHHSEKKPRANLWSLPQSRATTTLLPVSEDLLFQDISCKMESYSIWSLWLAVFIFLMFWGASTLLRLSALHFFLLLNADSAPSCAWVPLGWTFGQVPFLWQISQAL